MPRRRAGLGDLLRQEPREAVLAGLVQDHVEAVAMPVREVRPLAGLEVEAERPGPLGGVPEHPFECDVEGLIGGDAAGDALKPEGGRAGIESFDLRLDVDVRQNAVWQRLFQAEGVEQVEEGPLDGGDRLGVARDRVVAEDDVPDGVGPAAEDLPADVVSIVSRGVRLDAGAEVALGADLRAGEGVEDTGPDGGEFGV